MTSRIAIAAAVAAGAALTGPAHAQGTSSEAAALRAEIDALRSRLDDIEARREEVAEPSVVAERADRGATLTVAGRVNQALLYARQGDQDQAFVVDNDASGSRFEFLAATEFGGLTTGVEIVVSAEVNSTDEIDFGFNNENDDALADLGDFRQAHWFIEGERFGSFSIGQGDTAAEDTAHVDLSGTDFAGSGSDVDDIAGGLFFAGDVDDELFGEQTVALAELDDFFDMQDGSRALRILYATPEFRGAALKFSLQNDDESLEGNDDGDDEDGGLQAAVGIEYEAEFGDGGAFELEASYRQENTTELTDVFDGQGFFLGTEEENLSDEFVVGSASILLPSGLNLTAAGSRGFIDGEDEDTTAAFAKIGYIADLTPLGETRFSLDYFRGRNAADFADLDGDLPTAQSVGLFAVQELRDLNTELYVGARVYSLDDVFLDGSEVEVDDLTAVIAGARVRF